MNTAQPLRRALDVLTICTFVIALTSSRLDEFIRDDSERGPLREGRRSAPCPGFPTSLSDLNEYSTRFETYYFDTFGLRDVLLRWNTIFDYFVLGLSPSSDLVVGRDRWIFYAGDWTFENLRGVRPFGPEKLAAWRAALESRRDALAAAGCAYMYVACPNKESIYSERLPEIYEALGPTPLDQISAYLAQTSSVEFLDLRGTLLAEKAHDSGEDTLYPAHGTHWMGRGAFAAYRAITEQLSRRFPDMHRYDIAQCRFTSESTTLDSWSPKMYLGESLKHRLVHAAPIEGTRSMRVDSRPDGLPWRSTGYMGDGDGPRAIVFCDSFVEAIQPFLSDSFDEVLYVTGADLSEQQIADFRPDVVIDSFVERRLVHPPPVRLSTLPIVPSELVASSGSRTRLFALDRKAAESGLVATGDAQLAIAPTGADTHIVLSTPTNGGDVRLPTVVVPEETHIFLHARGSSSKRELLDVYWRPKGEPRFKVAWRVSVPLDPTDRTRTVEMEVPRGPLEVMVRTRGQGSTVTLREFELYAAVRQH